MLPELGPDSVWYNETGQAIDLGNGRVVAPGGLIGYPLWTMWPAGSLPACTAASDADQASRVWAFTDTLGNVLADAQVAGFGETPVAPAYRIIITPDVEFSSNIGGAVRATCLHTDGTAPTELASIPVRIAPDPHPLYASTTQFTLNGFRAGNVASLDLMGFAPGEEVTVSLINTTGGGQALLTQAIVTADGAGGVAARLDVPAAWGGSIEMIDFVAAGATSRYVYWNYETPDTVDPTDGAFHAYIAPSSDSPSGRAALVGLYGYDPGATVKVYLHSSGAPVELGTVTVGGDGTASVTLPLPESIPLDARLWAGEKTGGYVMLSAPLETLTFRDVPANYVFHDQIAWMADQGISLGYDVFAGREYRPFGTVTRDQMAAFLYRYAGSPDYDPPTTSPFVDVPTNYVFYKQIAWLASERISTGWDVGGGKKEYRPFQPVSRDVMAAFLYRSAGSPAFEPPASSPFVDIPKNYVFYKEISWLAAAGISTGWDVGGGKKEYRPFSSVLRDQMAAFLYRSNALLN
ncbi:hypothetical protein [Microbacterium sp. CH-015]|uniref:hypothetical protein n=1 Tax=Microbacterium sp. CH-015 TaxID=3406734 RepID=UPI003C772784